jgi:hypothetical protein
MWFWKRIKRISWADHARREEVLKRVEEDRNILQTINRRKAVWIGHIFGRSCLLKHVIDRKIDGRICDRKKGKKT